uniref:Kinesin-like protein n=3 Tax=Trichobilharzia regenti TaxID=157069 RepID=A0AA85K123_TRIRE|nr:unnamed protein product [Trichobilharzia regenti]
MNSDGTPQKLITDKENTKINMDSTQSLDEEAVGFINIPGRGKLQTQIFETRTRVHCYFDPDEATWLRLPIAWELNSPVVMYLINLVKDVCPTWRDDADILAALRVSNYNVDDCVNIYHSTIGKSVSSAGEESNTNLTNSACKVGNSDFVQSGTQKIYDHNYYELVKEVEILKKQIHKISTELQHEKKAHERLKLFIQSQKSDKQSNSFKFQGLSGEIHSSFIRTKEICQDVKDILHGSKHILEDFTNTLCPLLRKTKRLYTEQNERLKETKAVYRLESQQRRLIYNRLIEIRGNIRVFCRIRPSNCINSSHSWLKCNDNGELFACLPNASRRKYKFDNVFHANASQTDVFKEIRDIIASSIDGYNVCIMAYGQTGSGKTYTMEGHPNDPGIYILSIRELLRLAKERRKTDFQLSISILEIYNENIVDLLNTNGMCDTVEIRHNGSLVNILGATWMRVSNENDMHTAISLGQKGRHVASTKLNTNSSRSHLIVSVSVIGTNRISGTISRGHLTLCDLAGSERVEKSEATSAERFNEATHINLSLSALAQVFMALRNNQLHVPYRNAKLTQMLQPCLGGDAKTCLIVNINEDPASMSETLSSLQFGTNARQITLGPAKAHITNIYHN